MGGCFVGWYGPSGIRCSRQRFLSSVLLLAWLVLSPVLLAEEQSRSPGRGPFGRVQAGHPAASAVRVNDVVLCGGVLHGIVLPPRTVAGSDSMSPVAGLRVAVIRDGRVVAETKTDGAGRFAVSHLRGGNYTLAVARGDRVEWSPFRAWTEKAAPPKAFRVAQLAPAGVVRGQGALPAVSFSEAALMAGVVGGAVAAPIIYHNAQKSNRVPASP